jgi:hypothetical protein
VTSFDPFPPFWLILDEGVVGVLCLFAIEVGLVERRRGQKPVMGAVLFTLSAGWFGLSLLACWLLSGGSL